MQTNVPEVARDQAASGPGHTVETELAQRTMELARSDAVRRAVTLSATELLRSLDPDRSVLKVMELIGASIGASRIQLFENQRQPDGRLSATPRYEWDAPGVPAAAGVHKLSTIDASAWEPLHLVPFLAKGETRGLLARNADEPLRTVLQTIGVKSVLLTPVFVDNTWWGEVGFDDCDNERAWSPLETDTLRTLAELVGSAVARSRDFKELSDASRIIENSRVILYRLAPYKPYPLTYVSHNVSHYGYGASALLSSPVRYLDLVHPDDLSDLLVDLARIASGQATEVSRERRIRAADGRLIWVEDKTRALYGDNRELIAIEGILLDISERKAAEERIEHLALTDPLTGLASRKAFTEELRRTFAAAELGGAPFAILYLDLDHFKDVNDVLGHTKGDEILKLVAQRLKHVHRTSDLIARFGGDEFAFLQTGVFDPSDAGALAARILHELTTPFDIGTQVDLTASIGIAVYVRDLSGPEELIKQADMALYRAKDLGRNQYHFHSEKLDIAVIERVTLAGDLRRALDRSEMEVYYQPQVEVSSQRIVGLEALLRWHHPKHGLLRPDRFIPIAEKSGAIVPLGRWVIEDVCRQIAAWRAENLNPPTTSINISAAQIKALPEFDAELAQILRKWKLEPDSVELELTESVLMETTREHREVIDRLRALGVPIAIDDFGTGYSSLGYLRSYRVSHIKIAQEFIRDLPADSGDVAIVRAAISLARELGIEVIAEGVETAVQLELLAKAGCRYIQGYHFSPPLPAHALGELLQQGRITAATRDQRPVCGSASPKFDEQSAVMPKIGRDD